MDKEMLAIAKFKEGKFDTFMSWFQSDAGMTIRKSIAHVEQTIPAFAPDKTYTVFKVTVHNEENMKQFVTGNNPESREIFEECIENVQLWELNKVNL